MAFLINSPFVPISAFIISNSPAVFPMILALSPNARPANTNCSLLSLRACCICSLACNSLIWPLCSCAIILLARPPVTNSARRAASVAVKPDARSLTPAPKVESMSLILDWKFIMLLIAPWSTVPRSPSILALNLVSLSAASCWSCIAFLL